MSMAASPPPLLKVRGLGVEFRTRGGTVHALQNIALRVDKGEIVGLVGESGSGKSVLSYAMLRILDPAARITGGTVSFGGMDLLAMPDSEMAQLRGRELSMIFQNPRTALNPIRRIGDQIGDVLARHTTTTAAARRGKVLAALEAVRIPDAARRLSAYPFELSGGQCQRVMIAMALASDPQLLIADEPTTGLDVTTQAAIMRLLATAARERHMATVLITHDLALAAQYCDRIVVMHAGHVVESAPTRQLFAQPRHPYTQALIRSVPGAADSVHGLLSIAGNLPDLRRTDLPACRFVERCERASAQCRSDALPELLVDAPGGSSAACHHPHALEAA
jgi:peptide/nickel transport system ATP-binding protein